MCLTEGILFEAKRFGGSESSYWKLLLYAIAIVSCAAEPSPEVKRESGSIPLDDAPAH